MGREKTKKKFCFLWDNFTKHGLLEKRGGGRDATLWEKLTIGLGAVTKGGKNKQKPF